MIRETAFDYDNCIYYVYKDDGATLIKFGFKCNCSKEILASGGQQMLDELYAGKPFFPLKKFMSRLQAAGQ